MVTVLSFASIISELIDILFFKVTSSLLLLSRETKLTCLEFIGGHVVYYRKNIFLNKLNIQQYISQVSWKLIKISTKCLSTLLLRTRAQTFATANIGHQSSRQCNQGPTCISSRRRLLPYPTRLHIVKQGQDGVSLSEAERLVSTVSCQSDTTRTVKRLGRCHLFLVPPRGKLPQDDAAVYLFGTHWIKGIQSLVNSILRRTFLFLASILEWSLFFQK